MSRKCFEKKPVDLLVIGEEGKKHYVLIKYFNTFKHDYTLNCVREQYCRCCLQPFSTEEI